MTDKEQFELWLTKPEVLEVANEVAFEFGDSAQFDSNWLVQEDSYLYKLLWMAFNWGLVTKLVDSM